MEMACRRTRCSPSRLARQRNRSNMHAPLLASSPYFITGNCSKGSKAFLPSMRLRRDPAVDFAPGRPMAACPGRSPTTSSYPGGRSLMHRPSDSAGFRIELETGTGVKCFVLLQNLQPHKTGLQDSLTNGAPTTKPIPPPGGNLSRNEPPVGHRSGPV